jgi:hypothetical protein
VEHLILLELPVVLDYQLSLVILEFLLLMELQDHLPVVGLVVVEEEELIQLHLQQDHLVVLVVEELEVMKIREMQEKELLEQQTLVAVAVDVEEMHTQDHLIMDGEGLVDLV